MIKSYLVYYAAFAAAFLGTFVSTFFVREFVARKKYFDQPAKRKVHDRAIPTLGGVGIWLGFCLGMAIVFLLTNQTLAYFIPAFIVILIVSLMIILTGVYDDLHDLPANVKLIIQVMAAVIIISLGFEIHLISAPSGHSLSLGTLSLFISILWIVGIINATNLLDGLDGLAAGVSGISALFLFVASFAFDNPAISLMSIAFAGAVFGFLPHNFHPAKIFMGNTGSMFLGLMLSLISIAIFQKKTAVFTLFVPLTVMAIPILDTFLSILRRLINRKPIFSADKEHLHHKLLFAEKSQVRAVLSLYFFTFCYGLIALSFSDLQGIYGILAVILVFFVTIKWLKDWGLLKF